MSHLLAIDPGLSTGCFLGHYSDTEPLSRVAVWQFGDKGDEYRGVEALLRWCAEHTYETLSKYTRWTFGGFGVPEWEMTIIAEKFTPLQNKGHSLTLDAVEPLRCEGALIANGLMPAEFPHMRWQRPDRMYFSGGTDLAAKKKASRAWLKSHELLPTGKTVGQPNAHDAVSATLHAFAYMRKINHLPTLAHYWPEAVA
jgi:hypothetical protein